MRTGLWALLLCVLGGAFALGWVSSTAAAATFEIVSQTRLTTDPGDEYDSAISGELVVYTGNRANDTDVYYVDLGDGIEHPVTAAAGPQELTDVSGTRIVYSDLVTRDVWVHDAATGTSTNLTASPGAFSTAPSIGGDLVAWEDSRDGNIEIYALDLASGEERRITTSAATDVAPQVRDGKVAFQVCDLGMCDIAVYDWATGTTRTVTSTPDGDERRPDLDGDWAVYDAYRDGERDIYAYDLQTGQERRLSLPGSQNNPNISGDRVTFEDVQTGTYRVRLWDLAGGGVYDVTSGIDRGEFLNDIDGDRVVYTAFRENQLDIYVAQFRLTPGDGTAPSIEIGSPVDGGRYTLGSTVLADYACSDEPGGSGVATCTADTPDGQPVDTSTVGEKTFTVTATDAAGNTVRRSVTYLVAFDFGAGTGGGFASPIDTSAINEVKAGATVPVKFGLGGNHGLDILASGYPVSQQVTCDTDAPVSTIEETLTSGNSGLRYDATADQYIYAWKTSNDWAGTCRQLRLQLTDGTLHSANFRLK